MGVLSHARAACLDEVALDALAHHRSPPPELDTDRFGLIAEIKFSAPSSGVLQAHTDPVGAAVERALKYEAAGAHAISVLTEPTRFGGSIEHLTAVSAAVQIPVMRKDFIVDPAQVLEARAHGAGGVLLIIRMLDDVRLDQMMDLAHELGLFVLLEAFDGDDLKRAGRYPGSIVGLNCRDLRSLQVDVSRLETLQNSFPDGVCRVAESGLSCAEDARKVALMGYGLALVGSALMRSDDPTQLVADMTAAGREASCTFM
jgi:indole-3-glycerol phosphate synthase